MTALEVTEAYLDRIDRLDSRLNAFISVTRTHALDRARRADRDFAQGIDRGPLQGVPYALKDVIATSGILTTNGSRSSATWVPEFDATVQQRLDEAGAVLLGKLNLWELAIAGAVYGQVRNPWHLDYDPGGSSSGAGAAVAGRLVPLAIGTDTGGSIRVPAAHCGVVGLRPTYGRVSRYGVTANAWSVDTVGPLATTVEDAASALAAIAGADSRDKTCSTRSVPSFSTPLPADLEGVRLGIPSDHFFDRTHPDVAAAVHRAIDVLVKLGARRVAVDLPHAGEAALVRTIHLVEAASCHESRLRAQRAVLGAGVRDRLERAQRYTGVAYVKALRLRTVMRQEAARAFQTCDVLISPTDRGFAQPIARSAGESPPTAGPTTHFASMTGLPALALPCGFSRGPAVLPVSLQLQARPFDEALLCVVGRMFQRETSWHASRPVL